MTTDSVISGDQASSETQAVTTTTTTSGSQNFGGIPQGEASSVAGGDHGNMENESCETVPNCQQQVAQQSQVTHSTEEARENEEYEDGESLAPSSLGTSIEINLVSDCARSTTSATSANFKGTTLSPIADNPGRDTPTRRDGRTQKNRDRLTYSPSPTPPPSRTYPPEDAPLCSTCSQLDCAFFNVQCVGCWKRLEQPDINIGHLFAIIRQWVPEIQESISLLIKEMIRRGASVNDRDGLTDMTLLHYAVKAGAMTVSNDDEQGKEKALQFVQMLVEEYGADVTLKCRWNDMSALHYAVFFDVPMIVDYLLMVTQNAFIDDPCSDFDGGTPLHIASHTAALESARVLIKRGANVLLKDSLGRTALDCVPDVKAVVKGNFISMDSAKETIRQLTKLMEEATVACIPGEGCVPIDNGGPNLASVNGKVVLRALGLRLNDRVLVGGPNGKYGVLRYCGATQFANGIWAGVELDEPEGRNDGSVGGVTYWHNCPPNCGIFAPIAKISKVNSSESSPLLHSRRRASTRSNTTSLSHATISQRPLNFPLVDVSKVTSKIETGLSNLKANNQLKQPPFEVKVGDRVLLTDNRRGVVRFIGETQFAPGLWYGIDLSKPRGKNNGSVNGLQYFEAKPNHGVFASASRISRVLPDNDDDEHNEADDEDNDSNLSLCLSRCSIDADHVGPGSSLTINQRTLTRSNRSSSLCPLKDYSTPPKRSPSGGSWLKVGVKVYVNNQVGILRYIGHVHFADGVWLGVELPTPTGKNDGMVKGKRYFTTKAKHGLLVRPKKVNVRGINGAKLIPDPASKANTASSPAPAPTSSSSNGHSQSESISSNGKLSKVNGSSSPLPAIKSSVTSLSPKATNGISNGSPSKPLPSN